MISSAVIVLSGKWKGKTQHEETASLLPLYYQKEKKSISEEKITSHGEVDAGVWKLGCANMHRNVRKPALGGNGLNSPDVEYKLTIKH